MEYNLQDLSKSEKQINFTIPADKVKKAIDEELKKIRKEAKIPGFRAGKTPMSVVMGKFYPLAESYAQEEIIKEALGEFVDKNPELKIVSTPQVTDLKIADDKIMTFSVKIELFPEVELKQYTKIPVKKVKIEITDSEVLDTMKNIADRFATFDEKSEAGIEKNDYINIDFQVLEGDKKIDEVKNYSFYVSNLKEIPGFEEGLIGLKKGEEKDIHVKYPEDYVRENLRDKDVVYKVKVNTVKQKQSPEITDEFIKKNFPHLENIEAFKEDIRKKLQESQEKVQKDYMMSQVYQYLIENNPFDIPENFLNESMEKFKDRKVKELKMYGYNEKDILSNLTDEFLREETIRVLKHEIILESVKNKEHIEILEEEINHRVNEDILKYGKLLETKSEKEISMFRHELSHKHKDTLEIEKIEKFLLENVIITVISKEEFDKEQEKKEEHKHEEEPVKESQEQS